MGRENRSNGRIAAAPQCERDLPPQQVDVGAHMIVGSRPRLGDPQQIEGIVDGARLELGLCRGQSTLRAAGGLGRQLHRTLEKGGGGREATARLRPGRGMLQLGRDVLIRDGRRVRAIPGATIRVDVRVRGLRESSVDLAPLLRAGCPVDGRANERVAKRHSGGERQQTFRFQNVSSGRRDPEPVCCSPHKRRVADRVRRRHEQQAARSPGQPLQPPQEAFLDAGGDGHGRGQAESARELG